jgi:hypothetical protein
MMTSHRRLRASLIGAALMTSTVAIAIYVVPAAEAPYEPEPSVGCIQPERLPELDVTRMCGGTSVPFLTHEHRETSGVVTRFELFPRGEWRRWNIESGEMVNGCTGSMTLGDLRALATPPRGNDNVARRRAMSYRREPKRGSSMASNSSSTTCAMASNRIRRPRR